MYEDQGNWHRIGEVGVDSGSIMVTDPCYVLRDSRDEDKGTENGLEYLHAQRLDLPGDHPESPNNQHKLLAQDSFDHLKIPAFGDYQNAGVGFIIPSGFGDGAYPIFLRTKDFGDWGTRVTGIFIDLNWNEAMNLANDVIETANQQL